jgi:hypothetical protein
MTATDVGMCRRCAPGSVSAQCRGAQGRADGNARTRVHRSEVRQRDGAWMIAVARRTAAPGTALP